MNLLQELRSLDPRDPGRWPLGVRMGAIVLLFMIKPLFARPVNNDKPRSLTRRLQITKGQFPSMVYRF
jgi:hypothetical protein